jgi:hypothetical protein
VIGRLIRGVPGRAAALGVALAVAALASLAPASPLAQSCSAAGSNRAALVVEHGDGSTVTRCVSFDAGTVTGEWLLDSSGVAWSGQSFGGFGQAVCAVDAEPAHFSTCPGKDSYWASFVSRGGGPWQFASVGISSLTLADGDALGFRYVPTVGSPAPPTSPVGVCAAAATAAPSRSAASVAAANPPVQATLPAEVGASPATTAAVADATASAGVAAAAATAAAQSSSGSPAPPGASVPSPTGGIDPGLLLAAVTGGGLAGLALLRVFGARRRRA